MLENKALEIANEIKEELQGIKENNKIMIRRCRKFKGLEEKGVWSFDVYYDVPLPIVKASISNIIEKHGGRVYHHRIIGGSYGYTVSYKLGEREMWS